jgi:hypothetical protein
MTYYVLCKLYAKRIDEDSKVDICGEIHRSISSTQMNIVFKCTGLGIFCLIFVIGYVGVRLYNIYKS